MQRDGIENLSKLNVVCLKPNPKLKSAKKLRLSLDWVLHLPI